MQSILTPDIIRSAVAGNTKAFRAIVEEYQQFAYTIAYRFVHDENEAEDIAQESFIRLWKNIKNYKPEIKLSTWLYRIIVNLCLDYLKSARYKQQKEKNDLANAYTISDNTTPEKELQHRELVDVLIKASSTLTPKQKAVFIMRDLEELSVDEVSVVLSMSAGTIKSNLYYARQHVYELIRKHYQIATKYHEL